MLVEKCINRKKSVPHASAGPLVLVPCTIISVTVSGHLVISYDSFLPLPKRCTWQVHPKISRVAPRLATGATAAQPQTRPIIN